MRRCRSSSPPATSSVVRSSLRVMSLWPGGRRRSPRRAGSPSLVRRSGEHDDVGRRRGGADADAPAEERDRAPGGADRVVTAVAGVDRATLGVLRAGDRVDLLAPATGRPWPTRRSSSPTPRPVETTWARTGSRVGAPGAAARGSGRPRPGAGRPGPAARRRGAGPTRLTGWAARPRHWVSGLGRVSRVRAGRAGLGQVSRVRAGRAGFGQGEPGRAGLNCCDPRRSAHERRPL